MAPAGPVRMMGLMGTSRTRIRLYRGIVEAEAEQRFRADAVWALRDGWQPSEWRWDGRALRVVYTIAPTGHPTRMHARRRLRRWLPQLTGSRRS
jgi:hypothetical protein